MYENEIIRSLNMKERANLIVQSIVPRTIPELSPIASCPLY